MEKELQLVGIKMLRKIIEVCNEKNTKPAADWQEEWFEY